MPRPDAPTSRAGDDGKPSWKADAPGGIEAGALPAMMIADDTDGVVPDVWVSVLFSVTAFELELIDRARLGKDVVTPAQVHRLVQ